MEIGSLNLPWIRFESNSKNLQQITFLLSKHNMQCTLLMVYEIGFRACDKMLQRIHPASADRPKEEKKDK